MHISSQRCILSRTTNNSQVIIINCYCQQLCSKFGLPEFQTIACRLEIHPEAVVLIDYFSSILQVHLLDWTVILEILSHSWRGEKPSLFLLQLFWILDWIGASRKYYGYDSMLGRGSIYDKGFTSTQKMAALATIENSTFVTFGNRPKL